MVKAVTSGLARASIIARHADCRQHPRAAYADAGLYLANATAEAVHAESAAAARVVQDNAKQAAVDALNADLQAAAEAYALAVAQAEKDHYLAVSQTEDGGPGGYWGGAGYYYGYAGWYSGGGGSGFVYGAEEAAEEYPGQYYGWGGDWGWDGGWGYGYGYGAGWDGGWGYGNYGGYSGLGGYYGGYGGYGGYYGGYYGYGSYTPNPAAEEAYQAALEDADDARQEATNAALTDYVGLIGDAQIGYAEDLGDANIVLATARGSAAWGYRFEVNAAEATAHDDLAYAGLLHRNALHTAQAAYTGSVAAARLAQVTAEETANIGLADLEGTAAVLAASDRATAEAAYHEALAVARADQLEALAASLNTPQADFDALAANVKADWISDLAAAFVTRETAKVYAEEGEKYGLAVAQGNQKVALATMTRDLTIGKGTAELDKRKDTQIANEALVEASHVADAVLKMSSVTARKTLEIAAATASKAQAACGPPASCPSLRATFAVRPRPSDRP